MTAFIVWISILIQRTVRCMISIMTKSSQKVPVLTQVSYCNLVTLCKKLSPSNQMKTHEKMLHQNLTSTYRTAKRIIGTKWCNGEIRVFPLLRLSSLRICKIRTSNRSKQRIVGLKTDHHTTLVTKRYLPPIENQFTETTLILIFWPKL